MTAPIKKSQGKIKAGQLFLCALYALCGAVFALPLIIPKAWFLAWFAAFPVFYFEIKREVIPRGYISAYFRGMFFFISYGLIAFQWLWALYPLDFLGFKKSEALVVVLVAHIGIPLMQAVSFSLLFVAIYLTKKFTSAHPVLISLFISSIWVVCEWGQTKTWLGVPWGRLGAGQIGFAPSVQSASLLGTYLVSFLIIFCNVMLAYAFLNLKKSRAKFRRFALVFALVFVANLVFGYVRVSVIETKIENADKKTVAVLQGNISFEEKWKSYGTYTYDLYAELAQKAADDGAEIMVLPETALPFDLREEYDLIIPYLNDLSNSHDATVLTGVFNTDNGNLYNSVICADKGKFSDDIYSKRRLVPFGEFVPMQDLTEKFFPLFAQMVNIEFPISAGSDPSVMETENGRIGCLVCFDAMFDSLCLDSVRSGAQLLSISTNDSWFDNSTAQAQNNAHAALRAVENGRFAIRSANTGLSSIISPTGETITTATPLTEDYAVGDVCMLSDTTPYTVVGNIIVPICTAMASCIFIACFFIKKKGHYNYDT